MNSVLTVILAGGKGSRLEPLTRDRAKPAVPFGGAYRIIDFALSNCLNSGLRKIVVLTQYKASSLDRHIDQGWKRYFCAELGEFIDLLPPQQRIDENWYRGTADAVYQNIYSLERERPRDVLILAGDHIYKMDYQRMVAFHRQNQSDLTIGTLEVSPTEAKKFGVVQVDATGQLVGFQEKPSEPKTKPGSPDRCLVSMGIYVFSSRFLFESLLRDANDRHSTHDFGNDIIPSLIGNSRVFAFPFEDRNAKREPYWRDVGTLDAYYEANMDLVNVEPQLNIYDRDWPIRTRTTQDPPPKFVFGSGSSDTAERMGIAVDSIVCPGCIVSGGRVDRSILGRCVRINSFARVSDSILFDGVEIGRNANLQRCIVDKHVKIPSGVSIGFDPQIDAARGLTVTESGVTVIGKGQMVESDLKPPKWIRAPISSSRSAN